MVIKSKKRFVLATLFIIGMIVGSNYCLVSADIATTISGTVHVSNPDSINHDITVVSGGTLIFDPGVTVIFDSCTINVNSGGTLIIGSASTSSQTILKALNDKKLSGWNGILNNGTVIIRKAQILDAQYGVNQSGNSGASLDIQNSAVEYCSDGLRISSGTTKILQNTFIGNGDAVYLKDILTAVPICGNTFGDPLAIDVNSNNYSIHLEGTNNVDIRFNSFIDGNDSTIAFVKGSNNSQVRIAFNNFFHHRDDVDYDPSQLNFFYIIGSNEQPVSPAVTVYNCYWENNNIPYTSITSIQNANLLPPGNMVIPDSPLSSQLNFGNADVTPPIVTEAGPLRSLETVSATIVISDVGWGVDPSSISISLKYQSSTYTATKPYQVNYNDRQYIFKATFNLPAIYGRSYTWCISGNDYAGNSISAPNDGTNLPALLVTNQLNVVTTPSNFQWQTGKYYMITVPISPDQQDQKTVLGLTQADTILARSQDGTGNYVYYGQSSFDKFAPGKGFWLKMGSNETIQDRNISGLTQNSDLSVAFSQPGWYMIGNPFSDSGLEDLSLNNISFTYTKPGVQRTEFRFIEAVSDGYVGYGLWGFNDPSYTLERNTILRWRGYWINIKKACTINFKRTAFTPSSVVSWEVQMIASQNQNVDGASYFGLAQISGGTVDLLDSDKPPVLHNGIISYFSPQGISHQFGTDLRSASSTLERWQYTISGLSPGMVQISWNNFSFVPANYQIILKDSVTGTETDLRRFSSYRFNVTTETQRKFEIIMTDQSGTAAQISNIQLSRNPFAPLRENLTINYSLNSAATIDTRIYDWVGNLVYIAPTQSAGSQGTYQIIWNGRNNLGRMVANGIYFCKMIARNGNAQNSQIIKIAVVN